MRGRMWYLFTMKSECDLICQQLCKSLLNWDHNTLICPLLYNNMDGVYVTDIGYFGSLSMRDSLSSNELKCSLTVN